MARPRQHLNKRPMARSITNYAAAMAAASLLFQGATAVQQCACSPSKYTLTLDFSLTCPPVNVTRNGGISATFCQISPFGDENQNITDLVATEIKYVDVLELGQQFEVLTQQNISGTFYDGDSFEFSSIVTEEGNQEIPKVLQLNMFANNAEGQPLVNFFAIAYSNDCDEYPTLIEGESAGWTQFTSLEPPSPEYCPAVPATPVVDSSPPTGSPTTGSDDTNPPTAAATEATDAPTAGPKDTDAPTPAATNAPTAAATEATDAPTAGPKDTDAPTPAATNAPTAAATEATDAPTPAATEATDAPTKAPKDTDAPTKSPTTGPEETNAPTDTVMSMDMSMDMSMTMGALVKSLTQWRDMQYRLVDFGEEMSMSMHMGMDMSMSMSMPVSSTEPASRPSHLRTKVDKTEKSGKSTKVATKEKSAKAAKVEKASKEEKSAKAAKVEKASKEEKSAKEAKAVRRRRRLRVHRID
eukprot:CAMPEP_0168309268 /NCGR_PEP_ID=MMETSP0142_2-20121227/66186_1 /TAXON_ID=44445 /ORGANISM="Pseudo-nitzschia australis, Strain 10249 10 AB" /LENGTH=469 /DNA_ID=CAMNT_0008261979 /DNA_START=371 /DNA_END=1780 /DNA_ORIENTATION=-